ncbi:uncharacterized protein BDZ83DRAFT_618066 [Colletotrichum acutatum]|uniref:Uncharacterized protein n=1 Tax=Glomerella acutata TaxID=27357 RepID=A0AAD8UM60_GLOAC|nr:uncharacterized protein BDZ83DRAFT_618066 [Colletotrichum acutatum]KAK1725913.1 hypothetical protein BDZ83DRAFT_618066 [Colletotrichum acutatum]
MSMNHWIDVHLKETNHPSSSIGLLAPVAWTDISLPALQRSRQSIEMLATKGDSGLHQLIRDFPLTEPPPPREDSISYITETLVSYTMYLMELQHAGYSNREAEASYLRIHHESFVDDAKVEPAKKESLTRQIMEAYKASEKLRDALEEVKLYPQRIQAFSTMEEIRSSNSSREAYLKTLLSLAPSQDGNATNTACPSTCASSTASSAS